MIQFKCAQTKKFEIGKNIHAAKKSDMAGWLLPKQSYSLPRQEICYAYTIPDWWNPIGHHTAHDLQLSQWTIIP